MTPRHEGGPEEPVSPLDHALGLRVAGFEQFDLGAQRPRERGGALGEFAPADASLVVPKQPFRDCPGRLEQRPHPAEQIRCCPRWQHQRLEDAGKRRRHHQHRRHALLATAQRKRFMRKPQIALHLLARLMHEAVGRVRRRILRADTRDSIPEHRRRPRPPHPLRQRRCGHRWRRGQQHPNLRGKRVKTRPARRALKPPSPAPPP